MKSFLCRFSTLHSEDRTGTTGWRWTRSPASSPSSPLGSNCLRGEVVIGESQPKQSLPSKARNRRRIPKIRMKTRTVIVTRAVTVDTRVMILTQTKRVRRWWRSRVVPQSFSAPRWPRSRSTTRRWSQVLRWRQPYEGCPPLAWPSDGLGTGAS